jgi:hypothetical protein
MNELNLNETTLDIFEQYSKQQLNAEEQTAFKNKLDQDHLLNAQYQAYLISKQVINNKIEDSLRIK